MSCDILNCSVKYCFCGSIHFFLQQNFVTTKTCWPHTETAPLNVSVEKAKDVSTSFSSKMNKTCKPVISASQTFNL